MMKWERSEGAVPGERIPHSLETITQQSRNPKPKPTGPLPASCRQVSRPPDTQLTMFLTRLVARYACAAEVLHARMAKIVRLSPTSTDLVGRAWDNVPPCPRTTGPTVMLCSRHCFPRTVQGKTRFRGRWLRQRWVMRRLGSSV